MTGRFSFPDIDREVLFACTVAIRTLEVRLPKDDVNRCVLYLTLSLHALMMGCLAFVAAGFDAAGGFLGALCALAVMLLYPLTVIGAIAWIAGTPAIQTLNASASMLKQIAAGALFLIGILVVATLVTATWVLVQPWCYAGFAALSGFVAIRGFRNLAREALPASLPIARLVA